MKIAYSTKGSTQKAVEDIAIQLKDTNPKAVLFFASSVFDQDVLCQKMQDSFPAAVTFGCSTAGEIISGKMLKRSIVAMALDSSAISGIKVEVLEDIKYAAGVKEVFKSFADYYKEPVLDMDYRKYVGIALFDGLSRAEENVMDKIGDLTNVMFVGGSAGDDLKFAKTFVYANGKAYSGAAVLALLKPTVGFDIIKTQSFSALDKTLTATKVNEENREVLEFNQKPAAEAYAAALGVTVNELPNLFMSNPVGLLADEEVYVRSPQRVNNSNVVFYCNILDGMEVSLLESTDIVSDTLKVLQDKQKELGKISGIINFNCILRTLELEQNEQMDAYGKLYDEIPTIGFSTYGEAYYGHINQTSVMLIFK